MPIPIYPKKHQTTLKNEYGATPIAKNFFVNYDKEDVFGNKITEQHKWEQFFWTKQVVEKICDALEFIFVEKTCCLTTPSLAHQLHQNGRDEQLLDIDVRFNYLPKFRYYDLMKPTSIKGDFRLLVIDPPFFLIPIEKVREAVDQITGANFDTKILIAFLKRAEQRLRIAFEPYNLVPTKFPLEYASIKPNKWSNFVLYSNIDLPGIKRMKE